MHFSDLTQPPQSRSPSTSAANAGLRTPSWAARKGNFLNGDGYTTEELNRGRSGLLLAELRDAPLPPLVKMKNGGHRPARNVREELMSKKEWEGPFRTPHHDSRVLCPHCVERQRAREAVAASDPRGKGKQPMFDPRSARRGPHPGNPSNLGESSASSSHQH